MVKFYKIHTEIVFQEDNIDPIYQELGLNADADIVEIVEDAVIDLREVSAANKHYEMTQLYMKGGHVLLITMEFDYFCALWKQI